MSKKATGFQKKEMSRMYRGNKIFKPLDTGWLKGIGRWLPFQGSWREAPERLRQAAA